jgi:riboflavin kinase/FMN adenylyltransferase
MNPALRLHRDLDSLPPAARGTVAAIGNFDGVHPGHRAVIAAAADIAARNGAPLSVVTFEPHPRRFFKPDAPPFRLASVRRKLELLAECGVAHVFALRFGAALAAHAADAFVDEILLAKLDLAAVVAGWDFAFGRGRAGTPATLAERMGQAGRSAHIVAAAAADDAAIYSSTAVRAALAAGDPQRAARLLGRPYAIDGHVRAGAKRGRTIGFPTANLGLGAHVPPAFGVYAVRVEGAVPGRSVAGVANLGVRPTVGGGLAPQLEAHLFDFAGDLYGRRLSVAFAAFLRPERKFADFAALKSQIVIDAAAARQILA